MNDFEFIKYEAIPNQKYLGLATVKLFGEVIVVYKVIPGRTTGALFLNTPSYLIEKNYRTAITIDSSTKKEALDQFIKENVRREMNKQRHTYVSSKDELPF